MWNAAQYSKFAAERSRPFADLFAQVAARPAAFIVDLGCGIGQHTQTLAEHWPQARVIGVDNSPEMLQQAWPRAIPQRLEFVQADLTQWNPDQPVDLIISNAALHWLDDHDRLLTRLTAMLTPSGTLAVQMPNRFRTPMQLAIDETVADPRWRSQLQNIGLHSNSVMSLSWYVHQLHDRGFAVDAWETTYLHILTGENPVLEWLKGTALRPLLQRLDLDAEVDFLRELGPRLDIAYPPTGSITLVPFPRLFFVASR